MPRPAALVAIAVSILVAGCATSKDTPPNVTAAKPTPEATVPSATYGTAVDVSDVTPIKALNETPASFVGRSVRIEGTVVGVCKGTGCWVRVRQGDGSEIIAKSLDHSVSVPTDCEGRSIVVQGTFMNMAAPDTKHVEEEHEPGAAPHECPEPEYLLTLDGAELGPTPSS